jgi:hypothetical protein
LSVDLYISKATEGIQKRIKENIEFAKANPYPKDELKSALDSAGQDSALSKLYTLDGQTENFIFRTPEVTAAAKEQADIYPGLWDKLSKGNKGIEKLKKNKDLENIKPANELNSEFAKFITELNKSISLGAKIKIDEVFSDKTDNDAFDEYLDVFNISLNTYGADSLVRSAFTELFTKKPVEVPKPVEVKSSTVNDAPVSTEGKKTSTASINSTTASQVPSNSTASNPINPTSTKSSEPTAVTSLDGGVTSKAGELQTENILDTNQSQAINVNLENKPTESKPAAGVTSNSTTATTTSNSTTVNDVNSASSVTSNPSNTSNNTGVTGDKNIMKVENTNNQSSSSTVNESKPEKEKGGFLSKVGNFAKKAGAALNLPSVGELGEQAKGLFGATGANISSRISEVKNSFAINSNKEESNSSPTSSTATNSVNSSNTTATTNPNDILAVPNTGTTSTTSDILKTETQTAMNVEQNKPAVAATQSPVTNQTTQNTNPAVSAVSNTSNSQNTSSPTTTTSNVSQNTQSAVQQPGAPAGGGVNVDTNQLAQSITRLERILISGIEVTIKDA